MRNSHAGATGPRGRLQASVTCCMLRTQYVQSQLLPGASTDCFTQKKRSAAGAWRQPATPVGGCGHPLFPASHHCNRRSGALLGDDGDMYVEASGKEGAAGASPAEWLDDLAAGRCTSDEFVARVLAREARDAEVMWEVLALLDQYYRRKRIERETFVTLKARLQRHSLGLPPAPRAASTPPARAASVPAAPQVDAPADELRIADDLIDADDAAPLDDVPAFTDTVDDAGSLDDAADDAVPLDDAVAIGDAIDDAEPLPVPHPAPAAARAQAPALVIRAAPDAAFDVPSMRTDAADLAPAPQHGLVEVAFHREIRPGDMLCGRYRVVDILQRTDWMTVAEAIDEPKAGLPGLRQRVALQVLDDARSHDQLLLQRIGKLQGLSHPAITRVLDVAEDSGALVLVTEFFNGLSLRELLARRSERRLPADSALGMLRTLADALAFAHARGVAHGDVTAANLLITDLGDLRLQGFELRAQSTTVQPSADRLAFARLAYDLLAGNEPGARHGAGPRLRAPPGISRGQWRALRDTLSGDGNEPAILTAFGAESGLSTTVEPVLLNAEPEGARPVPRRHYGRELLAAGIVAAIIGAGAYLYFTALPRGGSAVNEAALVADTAPPVETAVEVPPLAAVVAGETQSGRADAAPPAATPATVPATTTAPPARPAAAPVTRANVDLASTYAWVDTSEPVARIWVTRRGSLDREVTFRWWTETGTAQADRDFRAIAPRTAVIAPGERGVELLVPLMPDPARREPRTFFVKIDDPGPGATLGTRTLMQVAIVPPGYPAARDARAAQNVTPGLP